MSPGDEITQHHAHKKPMLHPVFFVFHDRGFIDTIANKSHIVRANAEMVLSKAISSHLEKPPLIQTNHLVGGFSHFRKGQLVNGSAAIADLIARR